MVFALESRTEHYYGVLFKQKCSIIYRANNTTLTRLYRIGECRHFGFEAKAVLSKYLYISKLENYIVFYEFWKKVFWPSVPSLWNCVDYVMKYGKRIFFFICIMFPTLVHTSYAPYTLIRKCKMKQEVPKINEIHNISSKFIQKWKGLEPRILN